MNNFFYQLLRKSQKYTGTDNVYLVRGGFWLALGQFASTGASFLLAVAFANLLDPATYGNYKYALSLFGILGIFSLSDIRTAVVQAVARNLEGSFYSGFKTQLRWGTLGSLIAVGMAVYYWIGGNKILPIPLLFSAVFLPLMNASRIYASFLGGKKLFNIQTKYNIVSQLVFIGIMTASLFLTKNILWLIMAYLITHTSINCFFYLLTKLRFQPNRKEDPQTIKFGKHLSLISMVSLIGSYLDKILLFTLAGPTQLAIYSFAVLVPEEIKSIAGNINLLALPKLAAKSPEEIKANIIKKLLKITALAGIIIILYIIIAPYFYKIFFPQYLSAILYSQVMIFSFISFPTSLLGTVFQAKMMKKELYLLKLIVSSCRIALFVILIPAFGIWGVIAATLATEVISSTLALFLFRKAGVSS